MVFSGPLTWTCHICGDERPDAAISVFTREHSTPHGVAFLENIRYCNDRATCVADSQEFSFYGDVLDDDMRSEVGEKVEYIDTRVRSIGLDIGTRMAAFDDDLAVWLRKVKHRYQSGTRFALAGSILSFLAIPMHLLGVSGAYIAQGAGLAFLLVAVAVIVRARLTSVPDPSSYFEDEER